MKNHLYWLFTLVFALTLNCNAESLSVNQAVASRGVSVVSAKFGRNVVSAKISTHEIDIGKPSDERPEQILSSCTYSRYPCSSVDYIEINVEGHELSVARSVYSDLSDVSEASLHQNSKGQFVLILGGGDASESYTVEILFDKKLLRQRTLMSSEEKQVLQKTIYYLVTD